MSSECFFGLTSPHNFLSPITCRSRETTIVLLSKIIRHTFKLYVSLPEVFQGLDQVQTWTWGKTEIEPPPTFIEAGSLLSLIVGIISLSTSFMNLVT